MKLSLTSLSALLCATSVAALNPAERLARRVQKLPKTPVIEKREASQSFQDSRLQKRASPYLNANTESTQATEPYLNAMTDDESEFVVNGTGIPDVPFDIGESYAGLLPISETAGETRELFFW